MFFSSHAASFHHVAPASAYGCTIAFALASIIAGRRAFPNDVERRRRGAMFIDVLLHRANVVRCRGNMLAIFHHVRKQAIVLQAHAPSIFRFSTRRRPRWESAFAWAAVAHGNSLRVT